MRGVSAKANSERRGFFALAGVAACIALGSACVGDIGDPGEPIGEVEGPVCTGEIVPGRSPIRRLTKFEYNNTVRDLLGDTTRPANVLPAEEEPLGFSNDATSLNVTPILAEKYMLVAESVAARATNDVAVLTGCGPDGEKAALTGCAQTFIESFGRRAFRRPMTEAEVTELAGLYDAAWTIYADAPEPTSTSHRMGIQMVLEAILQSPAFLYRVELGEGLSPVDPDGDIMPLTSYEMASRLSYFLWGSTPDEDLLALAAEGKLSTKEEIAAQARRMLDDDKAREAVAMFHEQWLDFDRVSNVTKDPTLYPEWSPALAESMKEEMRVFVEQVVFADSGGNLQTLLTAPYTFADGELAAHYGASVADDTGEFQRVDFAPEQRAGLLTMGALLSYYAHTNQTSPVHRGKLIREAFLCDILDPPPADVMFELPEPDPNSTARERFSQHSENPSCKGCHELMDPLGFGFENFDTLGRYRTKDNGQSIDASGSIIDSDIDGSFNGVRELADKLAASDDVKACYAKMWFRFAYGRGETKQDECSLERLNVAFDAADGNVKELLVALTQSDAFLYRFVGSNETADAPSAQEGE
ncbi:MAG: DUF1592 domain-containing protein [Polyangiaceae bacterium]|nr:DUF1592 domain-containing protein [Polyangiaceae bacterium]